jgi:CHAT domain-containing protein
MSSGIYSVRLRVPSKQKMIIAEKKHTECLDYATFVDLVKSNQYDIIHYNGHAYFDLEDSERNFMFFWKDTEREGGVVALNTNVLGSILKETSRPKFFYFSCCQGGATEDGYKKFHMAYLGFLDAIVSSDVPNALGMRWPVSAQDSKNFARSFYSSLFLKNNSLETSVQIARKDAFNYSNKSVWCNPVLIKQDF